MYHKLKVIIVEKHAFNNMENLVKTNNSNDSKENKILRQKAEALQKELFILTDKLESLKIDLVIIKQEYNIRIGRIYLKINELDLEILKFKKIEDSLKKNIPIEEAEKIIDESLKYRKKTIKEEYSKINEEKKIVEKRKVISEKERSELKKLWRKLVHKYHPDLAGNEEDRKKREEVMKKINKAYSGGGLEALKTINQEYFEDIEINSSEFLKTKVLNLESTIAKIEKEYLQLKKSEWYILKRNIENVKNKGRDLFLELEKKLFEDIAAKETIINNYQKTYGPK